jgi:hypothetical protein
VLDLGPVVRVYYYWFFLVSFFLDSFVVLTLRALCLSSFQLGCFFSFSRFGPLWVTGFPASGISLSCSIPIYLDQHLLWMRAQASLV